ncbi:Transposon TX1 uncharacterized 149 kDa protein [Vitis vinifera]|uniref:Transposon TX1 uncharacterized 149 kDa protein n=1 Tax=Vitis vinifera TaxID=29760 RepID=A0A438J801_VITVI|nr:Transposon TX1 uncharacterized 149 kDa protein [Vitis vinifera]
MRESERVRESDGDEGKSRAENRRKRKGVALGGVQRFLKLELRREKAKPQVIIVESKKGVSSWVRLGPASVGLFLEDLNQCIKDRKEGKWEKGWKEKERSYSLVRDANSAGCFLRLGVVDLEKKRYNICISKGSGEKGGMVGYAESLRKLDVCFDKKENKQEERASGRSYVEMVKSRKLEHWFSRRRGFGEVGVANGKFLGVERKARLVRLGKERVLLEFEFVKEARRVLISGKRNEDWVRILGPVHFEKSGRSVWWILNHRPTDRENEELQWARILVKTNGEDWPSSLEIENTVNCRGSTGRPSREVRGDVVARAGPRVEELANARLEEQFRLADGTGGQANGAGSEEIENRVQNGSMTRPSFDPSVAGPSSSGLAVGLVGSKRTVRPLSQSPLVGELLKGVVADGDGPKVGSSCSKGKGWAAVEACSSVLTGTCKECNSELEFIMMREKEDWRKQQVDIHFTMTDRALVEEASRGGVLRPFWGVKEDIQEGKLSSIPVADGPAENGNGCWDLVEDKRSMEILDWEVGQFSTSCRFRNVEDDVVWGMVVRGSASYRLATTLKEIKQNLKIWNRKVFGRLECNKVAVLRQGESWDLVERERSLTEEEIVCKKEAKEGYTKWVSMEETHWRQLSRELWLREWDRNTSYFHRMTTAHRRVNSLDRIKINEVWLSKEQEVREGTEVHAALMDMNGDKAPRLDSFTVAFWQSCWDFIKEEILDMFKEFHEQNSFLKSFNNMFLILLPKRGRDEDLGDYRPISLLEGLYKLLAKVLANRLKKVIGKVVSPDQNAFSMGDRF